MCLQDKENACIHMLHHVSGSKETQESIARDCKKYKFMVQKAMCMFTCIVSQAKENEAFLDANGWVLHGIPPNNWSGQL